MIITRSIDALPRPALSQHSTWRSEDSGLIKCWENGLAIRQQTCQRDQELAAQVASGELPSLGWKGGFETDPENPDKKPKMKKKFGCLQ